MTTYIDIIEAMLVMAKSKKKAQGSIEYLLMLSAVSIVIVIALAMIVQLKGAAIHAFYNSTNQSLVGQIGTEISNISKK